MDPLDAFMSANETSIKAPSAAPLKGMTYVRDDVEEEDDMVSFMKFKKNKLAEEKLKEAGISLSALVINVVSSYSMTL